MKTSINTLVLCTFSLALFLTSCLKDKDSEANVIYFADASVEFTYVEQLTKTEQDAFNARCLQFKTYVAEALQKMKFAGTDSQIATSAKGETMDDAVLSCDAQAVSQYEKRLEALTLDAIKIAIFDLHPSDMAKQGYATPDAIPLSGFTLELVLHNSLNGVRIKAYTYHF